MGWIGTAQRRVSKEASAFIRSRMPWMASSPPVPRIEAPRIFRVSASAISFMKPCVSPFSTARPTWDIGRVPTRIFLPVSRACFSVRPTRPSGGSMNRA
ncbi:hypothetical protein D3C87_1782460 [compost metagenome]